MKTCQRGFSVLAKDYYKILSLDPKCDQLDIKKRFAILAKEYHPDVNPNQLALFKDINEAYAILGKSEERLKYDRTRSRYNNTGGAMYNAHTTHQVG